jgi:serine/threonine protein kinase
MPYIENLSLLSVIRKRINADNRWKRERFAKYVLYDIAHALAGLHEIKTVHLDISPENVLIRNDYKCMLIDFGQSRAFDDSSTTSITSTDTTTNNDVNNISNSVISSVDICVKTSLQCPLFLMYWSGEAHLSDIKLTLKDLYRLDLWYLGLLCHSLIS